MLLLCPFAEEYLVLGLKVELVLGLAALYKRYRILKLYGGYLVHLGYISLEHCYLGGIILLEVGHHIP